MNAVRRPMDFNPVETARNPDGEAAPVRKHTYDSPRQAELAARVLKKHEAALRELAK